MAIEHIGVYTLDNDGNTRFDWSGSGVATGFYGTEIGIQLSTAYVDTDYMAYSIDGGEYHKFEVSGAKKTYTLATGLNESYHTVTVIKVTESSYLGSVITFYGFDCMSGAYMTPAVGNGRNMWFIGDSLTAGFGVEGANTSNAFLLSEENVTKTYGFKTALKFGAEYRATAISGGGLIKDCNGGSLLVPLKLEQAIYKETDQAVYGFKQPDVIVINLGTNDNSGGALESEYIAEYHRLIDALREKCPDAHIVCALGPTFMPFSEYISAVVSEEIAAGETNISACFMPMDKSVSSNMGAAGHPSETGHTVLAGALIAHISDEMGW